MLIDILKDLASKEGKDFTDPDIRNVTVFRINRAAQELHEKTDIQEVMDEIVVDVNQSSHQIALPSFCYQVRGMRSHDPRNKVLVDDIKNRYGSYSDFGSLWPLRWRKKKPSPLQREIANQSIIKVTLPLVEEADISVTITGTTEHSFQASETIIILSGNLEALGSINFKEPIQAITKDKQTTYDVSVLDVDDNVLAVIPNTGLQVIYNIYQIFDLDGADLGSSYDAIEVLYKLPFVKARHDQDAFFGTDKYDNAIINKYYELYKASSIEEVVAYSAKSDSDVAQAQDSEKIGVREKMDFKALGYMNLPYERDFPSC